MGEQIEEIGGACSTYGRGFYRVLVGIPEGKRLFGRPKHRWGDNIKMDLKKLECGGMDWIDADQDGDMWQALINVIMNLSFP